MVPFLTCLVVCALSLLATKTFCCGTVGSLIAGVFGCSSFDATVAFLFSCTGFALFGSLMTTTFGCSLKCAIAMKARAQKMRAIAAVAARIHRGERVKNSRIAASAERFGLYIS